MTALDRKLDTMTTGYALLVGALLAASPALADDFRCGTRLVSTGMTSTDILERCGRPNLIRKVKAPVFVRLENGATIQTGVEITLLWYYDRGPGKFVARVTIREEIAEEIDILDVKNIDSLGDEH
jgi:hypothetical protein